MKSTSRCSTTQDSLLHEVRPVPHTTFNRVFAAIYTCAVLLLLYYNSKELMYPTTHVPFAVTLTLFISDIILALSWLAAQAVRMYPVQRKVFPENLEKHLKTSEYPALDVFICTADPYKEPPINVVNTALSVMAYDYPTEKLSVYVSDDGGSAMTLFAFMEAAKFAKHWLPFCRDNNIIERNPHAYFASDYPSSSPEIENIKMMYEVMEVRIEQVVQRGKVGDGYITTDKEREAFKRWDNNFTRRNHPPVIQVLLDNSRDKDLRGHFLPNLIYVSREKSQTTHDHFKAGALNALLRVSALITNAPIILTLDCDMYSNDPKTPIRVLCYYADPEIRSGYGYVQFPQHFRGINKNDTYGGEIKRLFQIQQLGCDGLLGPVHVGTCCFFFRRIFFGGPANFVSPELPELSPYHVVEKPVGAQEILDLAYQVAGCNYENKTNWGDKIGYKYGSLVEDLFTGYRLQSEGWRSIFCNPDRAAFLGDAPISLLGVLSQIKRWGIGLLEVGFSKNCPITFGAKAAGPLFGLAYSGYAFSPLWCVPITAYAFLPQLALMNKISIFPEVSEPLFVIYAFLVLGAYGQDLFEFVVARGTFKKWWNDQRIWIVRGLSCFLFGSIEFLLKSWGISMHGFNVTNKAIDHEQSKRYEQGIIEFGVHSPMFVPLAMAAIINLCSFLCGLVEVLTGGYWEGLAIQMFIAGFGMLNCWPVYEAMVLRQDKGKLAPKTTLIAVFLSCLLCVAGYFLFNL